MLYEYVGRLDVDGLTSCTDVERVMQTHWQNMAVDLDRMFNSVAASGGEVSGCGGRRSRFVSPPTPPR